MYLSEIFNLLFYTMPYESEKDCKTISGANYGVFLGNEGVNFPVISHSTKSRIFLKKHCPGSRISHSTKSRIFLKKTLSWVKNLPFHQIPYISKKNTVRGQESPIPPNPVYFSKNTVRGQEVNCICLPVLCL